ncbi:MAG: hypothetical protein WDA72_11805, partial [Desulfomonilia bacterium]
MSYREDHGCLPDILDETTGLRCRSNSLARLLMARGAARVPVIEQGDCRVDAIRPRSFPGRGKRRFAKTAGRGSSGP